MQRIRLAKNIRHTAKRTLFFNPDIGYDKRYIENGVIIKNHIGPQFNNNPRVVSTAPDADDFKS